MKRIVPALLLAALMPVVANSGSVNTGLWRRLTDSTSVLIRPDINALMIVDNGASPPDTVIFDPLGILVNVDEFELGVPVFRLGVGTSPGNAEIQAVTMNSTGVIRYNGDSLRWEFSDDGSMFSPLAVAPSATISDSSWQQINVDSIFARVGGVVAFPSDTILFGDSLLLIQDADTATLYKWLWGASRTLMEGWLYDGETMSRLPEGLNQFDSSRYSAFLQFGLDTLNRFDSLFVDSIVSGLGRFAAGGGSGTQDSMGVDTDGNGVVDAYLYSSVAGAFHLKKGANVTLTVAGDTVTIAGPASSGTADSMGVDTNGNGTVDAYLYSTTAGAFHLKEATGIALSVTGDTVNLATTLGIDVDTTELIGAQAEEFVEDNALSALAAGTGTHTGITVTYQDATDDVDLVVTLGTDIDSTEFAASAKSLAEDRVGDTATILRAEIGDSVAVARDSAIIDVGGGSYKSSSVKAWSMKAGAGITLTTPTDSSGVDTFSISSSGGSGSFANLGNIDTVAHAFTTLGDSLQFRSDGTRLHVEAIGHSFISFGDNSEVIEMNRYLKLFSPTTGGNSGEGYMSWESGANERLRVGDGTNLKAFIPSDGYSGDAVVDTNGVVTVIASIARDSELEDSLTTKGIFLHGQFSKQFFDTTTAQVDPADSIIIKESGLTLSNMGGSVTDAQVPNTITVDNATMADSAQNVDTTSATALALSEKIADVAGGAFAGNTETGITATYQDADNTVDLVVALGVDIDSTELAATAKALSEDRAGDTAAALRAAITDTVNLLRNSQILSPYWFGGNADGPSDSVELSLGGTRGDTAYIMRDSSIDASGDLQTDTIRCMFRMPTWAATLDTVAIVIQGKSAVADSAEVSTVVVFGPDKSSSSVVADSSYYSNATARNTTSIARYAYAVSSAQIAGGDPFTVLIVTTLGANVNGVVYIYGVSATVSD